MKDKLSLRNVIIWSAAFLGLLVFCLSFAVTSRMTYTEGGNRALYIFNNGIWSGNHVKAYDNGKLVAEGVMTGKPFILPILGVILVFLAAAGVIAVSFLVKNEKLVKILSITSAAVAIVGGVFMFFVGETAIRTFVYEMRGSLDQLQEMKDALKAAGGKFYGGALAVILAILSILAGVAFGVAPFLPDKKLAK